MPSNFVPLIDTSLTPPASTGVRDNAAASAAFAAMSPGGKSSPAHKPGIHPSAPAPGLPSVTLQKDGDRVTHIRIHCACGQVIELECSY